MREQLSEGTNEIHSLSLLKRLLFKVKIHIAVVRKESAEFAPLYHSQQKTQHNYLPYAYGILWRATNCFWQGGSERA